MDHIFKFTPNRVWRTYQGGKLLDEIEGKEVPEDTSFPEDWIGSTVEARNVGREHITEGLAKVPGDKGELIYFKDLVSSRQDYFLGKGHSNQPRSMDDIPLVKYLDSSIRLHFQAHPTRAFSQKRLNMPRGKTEAYVILKTRETIETPYIYAGFQRPPSRNQLKEWIETQDISAIESCFDKIPVKAGDVFLIPGGRPHALGEGIMMLEIMEPSDLAVRFEFERGGYTIPEQARFMGRDIETALDVFNFDPVPPSNIDNEFRCQPTMIEQSASGNSLELLIGKENTPCFTVRKAIASTEYPRHEDTFFFGIVIEGNGEVHVEGEVVQLKQWDRFFCPAGVTDFKYVPHGDPPLRVLECGPGGI